MAGSLYCGTKPSFSIKCGEFVDAAHLLGLNKHCAPWSK